jgi:hypothetical protein
VSLALALAALLLIGALAPAFDRWFRGPWRHLRTGLALGAAPLLIVLAVWGAAGAGRFGDVRLQVREVAVGRQVLQSEALSIGGTVRDDVVAPGLPAGFVKVVRGEDGGVAVRAQLAGAPADAETLGVVEMSGKDGSRYLGAQPFGPGDDLCLVDCASPQAIHYRLAVDASRLEAVGHDDVTLPTMWTRRALGFTGFAFWKATARVYPLRDFAMPQAAGGEIDQDPCKRRWLCHAAEPVRSILFRDGSAQLWVILLDPGATLTSGGHTTTAQADAPVATWPAAETTGDVKLRLWKLDLTGPEVNLADEDERASRLDGGRWLTLSLSPDAVSASLDPAPYRAIAASDLTGENGVATLPVVGPSPDGTPPVATAAVAPGVGGEAGSAVSVALSLPLGQTAQSFEAVSGAAPRVLPFGGDFDVGQVSHGQGVELVMRVDRIGLPWPMIVVALAWALVLGLALRAAFADERRALMLLAGLQLLLALRWLIALDGSHLDFAADWQTLMRESALAYVAAPALLAILYGVWRRQPGQAGAWEAPAAIAIFLAALLAAYAPPLTDVGVAAREAALPLIGIAAGIAASADALLRRNPRAAARRFRPLHWLAERPLMCAALVMVDVAGRFIAAALGFKERIGGVPISLVYLPLALAGLAGFLYATRERRHSGAPVVFGALMLAAFVAAPGSVSDWGFCIFGFAMAFWVLPRGVRLWRERSPLAAGLWIAPSVAIAVVALAVCVIPLFGSAQLSNEVAHAGSLSDAQAEDLLGRLTIRDANLIRVWSLTDPGRVDAAGTDLAEQHRAWSASLSDYTGDLFGKGLLARSRLPAALTADHMDDNVSAVHVMAPFGRLGAAALLLLLFAQARWASSGPSALASPRQTLGQVSLWTLFFVATYMVLGNLQLLPFTGKNIYFLSPASTGDLWEGTVLFGLGLWGVAERSP